MSNESLLNNEKNPPLEPNKAAIPETPKNPGNDELRYKISADPTEVTSRIKGEGTHEDRIENKSRSLFAGRLIEYITGLQIDDPKLLERLHNDQLAIRGKYKLPPREVSRETPGEYEKILNHIAETYGIQINSKSECGSFFTENTNAGGVFFGESNKIGVDIDRRDKKNYTYSVNILEHEIIHGMQHRDSPRMPIELMEYEAYIAGVNLEHLDAISDKERMEMLEIFIGFLIGGSVNNWYVEQSEKMGQEKLPVWDDPAYFEKHTQGT